MAKDEGEGVGTKPSSKAKGVAKIHNDTVKAREVEAKYISLLRPDKKEVSLPSAKIRSKCRSHQIFGATKFGFHACVMRVQIWISHRRYYPYLLDHC